jgi:Rne/Rng family ribonuclease
MSKELVINASSHERRVAILEEGQLVEIYIEREKEFALVGSIYKGKVTRVLPGMQSAFVDIGLDGDAFLYVSDVFENLEDYDHGHGDHSPGREQAPAPAEGGASPIEVLPGESLGRAQESAPAVGSRQNGHADPEDHEIRSHVEEVHAGGEDVSGGRAEHAEQFDDERQPDSNESAPKNFAPQYNPTQYKSSGSYVPRSNQGGGRGDFNRGGSGGDRGGDRGRGGRWGRRGGRRRGGRPGAPSGPGGPGGGRNLPPSKYASPSSPQGGERDSRGYDQRSDRGGFDKRGPRRDFGGSRPEGSRYGQPTAPSGPAGPVEDEILLPGESLAKFRNRPVAAAPVAPVEEKIEETQPEIEDDIQPRSAVLPGTSSAPRRSRGSLPSWLLAGAGAESAEVSGEQQQESQEEEAAREAEEVAELDEAEREALEEAQTVAEEAENGVELSEEERSTLSASLIEAKQDEIREEAEADANAGGAEFDDEEDEGEEEHSSEREEHEEDEEGDESEERQESEVQELVNAPQAAAEAEADAAHENAIHIAALGDHVELEHHAHEEHEEEDEHHEGGSEHHSEHHEHDHHHEEVAAQLAAASPAGEEAILLPGETRSAHSGAPREEFPRDSARIGGNDRPRFQRPFRGGSGRDRGRGGDRGDRGGRPDRGRGGRGRFDRRPGSGGSHGHHSGGQRGYRSHSGPPRRPQLISEMLKAGQEVVVQIAKEPLGKKGARITSHVALPGRFLVYMPTVHHTGVSRKIISAENRSRLRRLVSDAGKVYPGGFIVRTAAGGATDDEIRADIEFLGTTWNEIKHKNEERKAPAILHRDLNLVERILRDYVSDDFTAIWIDSEEEYGKVVEFVSRFQPKLASRVKLYTKDQPIFEEFGIQHELDKALRAKVWLKSGGYIVINHTEALVAIDVNTGKFVGKGSTRLEDTIVKTNLEAVKEIVRQIRLRDLGGIIVVDFIDMEERRNREKVLGALQQALEQDKAPSKALSFNEFGLVCITRKRTKQALERVLCQPCPSCSGSGMVKSIPTLCYEIQSEARKMAVADHDNPNLTLRVHPEIAKALKTRESMLIDELEQNSHKHVIIQSDATLHWEQYDIY